MVTCPECSEELEIDEAEGPLAVGDELVCDGCGATLVVEETEPVTVTVADGITEDGEEDDEDEDEGDDFEDDDEDEGDEDDEGDEEGEQPAA